MPSLPMAFSDSDNTQFCLVGLRQNVQGKGNADGSILKQDKSRRRKRLRAGHSGPQCGPLLGLLRAKAEIPGTVWRD